MLTPTEILQAYVTYCPSCGNLLQFDPPYRDDRMESVQAKCPSCGRQWSMIFDLDDSGTFGVMSFQCDNQDRIM
jgi:predicted RNA-binding Zn-ribbon protein involved in translation (DUF1610 family)